METGGMNGMGLQGMEGEVDGYLLWEMKDPVFLEFDPWWGQNLVLSCPGCDQWFFFLAYLPFPANLVGEQH